MQRFGLEAASPNTQAALKFVEAWERKKVNRSTELEELVDYLEYFREAGGVIPLNAAENEPQEDAVRENEDAVRLITVHGAKGLEFAHVFILRANANSFPNSYKETLVAFPNELRDKESVAEGDDKTLHDQEERRLFYVAMTRARDSLQIYSRQGKGKNKNPDGYMRDLIENPGLSRYLTAVAARGAQASLEMFAAASPAYPAESQVASWFELPVVEGLHSRLSASAVESYQRCGLQFKLDRDWRLAAKPAAAMQYGATMHRVLKTYFDSVGLGRPKTDEELIEIFRRDLAEAGIQETYQRELYEQLGVAQLLDFLATARESPPQVLDTEQTFDIRVGATTVIGRIDRIDARADGRVDIVDYKTGKARDQKSCDESLQLSLYTIAAHEKWGHKVGSVIFYNLENNVPVVTTRDEAQLLKARLAVTEAAEGIAAGRFEAKRGMHCSFCAYRSLCPKQEKHVPCSVAGAGKPSN
jgi:DNA helicase-2/ATP-dependent DNA helicase PcrA